MKSEGGGGGVDRAEVVRVAPTREYPVWLHNMGDEDIRRMQLNFATDRTEEGKDNLAMVTAYMKERGVVGSYLNQPDDSLIGNPVVVANLGPPSEDAFAAQAWRDAQELDRAAAQRGRDEAAKLKASLAGAGSVSLPKHKHRKR